jgi:hypothetical protein
MLCRMLTNLVKFSCCLVFRNGKFICTVYMPQECVEQVIELIFQYNMSEYAFFKRIHRKTNISSYSTFSGRNARDRFKDFQSDEEKW